MRCGADRRWGRGDRPAPGSWSECTPGLPDLRAGTMGVRFGALPCGAMQPYTIAGTMRFICLMMGAGIGFGVAQTNPDREANGWMVFVLVSMLLGAASGDAFAAGVGRWRDVRRISPIPLW